MNFTVYKSSAGSGKTFTLVKEYLKIVLRSAGSFRHILAITFTNKAANEMKERVLNSLRELAEPEKYPSSKTVKTLLPLLCKEAGLDAETLQKNAASTLTNILHNYSDFAICTIDSFVHRIIRTFAHDLHINMNFEVEMDTDKLIVNAVDMLISRVGQEEKLTEILVNFLESKTDSEQSWQIDRDLQNFAHSLLREDGLKYVEKLRQLSSEDFIHISKSLRKQMIEMEHFIVSVAQNVVNLIHSNSIPVNAFYQTEKGIGKYFENLSAKKFDKLKPNNYVIAAIEDGKWYSAKADSQARASIDSIKEIFTDAYLKIFEKIDTYNLLHLLSKNIYSIAVLKEIEFEINEIKTRENLLPISEFNRKIASIVLNEPVPFIYERLGEKYRHFLIDEFQDTSVLQWQNLLPLLENSLANGHFNMIVGDAKQAIYRWRNGEVEQFVMLPAIFNKDLNLQNEERERMLQSNFKEEKLAANYRSKAEIVDFNNQFFSHIASLLPDKIRPVYQDVQQEFNKENTGGCVFIHFCANEDEKLWNFTKIEESIYLCQQDGFRLGDIGILCRSNNTASNIANFLLSKEIQVISSESLLLSCSQEVNFIIALLKYLLLPADKISRRAVYQYLFAQKYIDDPSTEKSLRSLGFPLFGESLIKMPVYDLCETLIRIFHLQKSNAPHLQFFLEAVLGFSSRNTQNISDFLVWWEGKKDKLSVTIPEGTDAVQVMTIHKSKGLEFPVVIYPFANETLKNTIKNSWVEGPFAVAPDLPVSLIPLLKEISETPFANLYEEENVKSLLDLYNIVYVAFTRPTHRLFLLSNLSDGNSEGNASLPKLLKHFLVFIGNWDEKITSYQFGQGLAKGKTESKAALEEFTLNTFISEPWQHKVLVSQTASMVWDVENPEKSRRWGNLIHSVLSEISDAEDLPHKLEELCMQGVIEEPEKKIIEEKIGKVVRHPDLAHFFTKESFYKTEEAILTPEGETYRPDRMVFLENATVILEYKTGEASENHINQINRYGNLLQQMGYNGIEKYLIYINDDITIKKV